MRISIPAVDIDGAICVEGDASLSVSSSVALRVTPVDSEGESHTEATITVVGGSNSEDIAELIETVKTAVEQIIKSRSES
jgi:hypothetical protein